MDEQIVVYVYNGILLSYKKERSVDTCHNLDESQNIMISERNQTEKVTYCVIPFNMIYSEWANPQRQKSDHLMDMGVFMA